MIDIDHFKRVNDRHGHGAGDDVLKFFAALLSLQLRGTDVCARTGGEEFAAVLPETSLEQGACTAERLRRAVEEARVPSDHAAEAICITVSVGAAELQPGESLELLLARADRALYAAKQQGRNRVVSEPRSLPRKAVVAAGEDDGGADEHRRLERLAVEESADHGDERQPEKIDRHDQRRVA
jgi:diguanylate cyclase (GGDEF)-like protein